MQINNQDKIQMNEFKEDKTYLKFQLIDPLGSGIPALLVRW